MNRGERVVIPELPEWVSFDDGPSLAALARALPETIRHRRWFGAKTREIAAVTIDDVIALPGNGDARLLLTTVAYRDGAPDSYLLPVRVVDAMADPTAVLLALHTSSVPRFLVDACHDEESMAALLDCMAARNDLRGRHGTAHAIHTDAFAELRGVEALPPSVWRREGSNTSVVFGDRLILKLFRRPEVGVNPDWELGRLLTDAAHFAHTPRTAAGLEYVTAQGEVRTLGILQELVPNEGDARQQFMASLRQYYETVSLSALAPAAFSELRPDWRLSGFDAPDLARELLTEDLQRARLLGTRTAQMHLAFLAAREPGLAPERLSSQYLQSLHASVRRQLQAALRLLQRGQLGERDSMNAARLLQRGNSVFERLETLRSMPVDGIRMRVHGDYHLEQVLVHEGDFVILDFEGEPSIPLSDRRRLHSPLKDVAGMLRSFDYAARPVLDEVSHAESGPQAAACTFWTAWVGAAFLDGYTSTGGDRLLPEGRAASEVLLSTFLLEKAAYEVQYELNNRPTWVSIPLRGILDQLA